MDSRLRLPARGRIDGKNSSGQKKLKKSPLRGHVYVYLNDSEIIEKAMESEALSSYFGGKMGVPYSLGSDDIANIKGVLSLILGKIDQGKKNSCTIEMEDVKVVTDRIKNHADIGV